MQKHPTLSDITKLYYLQQSLKGNAENVISEQTLNENNFQAAWNVLQERFENKRTIDDVHMYHWRTFEYAEDEEGDVC